LLQGRISLGRSDLSAPAADGVDEIVAVATRHGLGGLDLHPQELRAGAIRSCAEPRLCGDVRRVGGELIGPSSGRRLLFWILLQGCADVPGPPGLVVPAEGDERLAAPTGFGIGGLRPDDTQARLAPACQSDDFDACYRLGVSWRYGAEGVRNVGKARAYYRWACDHEVSDACDALERIADELPPVEARIGRVFRDGDEAPL
jgi:hypothetical protein